MWHLWNPPEQPSRFAKIVPYALLLALIGWVACDRYAVYRQELPRASLTRIGEALQAYHDDHQSFPPAYTLGPDGERWHSWRVLLLPYLGEHDLYREYRFDQPWNGEDNIRLQGRMPNVFESPLGEFRDGRTTHFLAPVDCRTAWPEDQASRREEIRDGLENTALLIEERDSRQTWMEPRDRDLVSLRERLMAQQKHQPEESRYWLFADGTVHGIPLTADGEILLRLLTARGGRPLPNSRCASSGVVEFGSPRDVTLDDRTRIEPTLTAEFDPTRNVLYCSTVQIGWDRLRAEKLQGRPVVMVDQPPIVDRLNAGTFALDSLSPRSYLSLVGSPADIRSAMTAKFPEVDLQLREDDNVDLAYVVYSHLRKTLPFDEPFNRLERPLEFISTESRDRVRAFGFENLQIHGIRGSDFDDQVRIVDYVNDDDFIIELRTSGDERDRILLAKLPPEQTLDAMWRTVLQRIESPLGHDRRAQPVAGDSLSVPVLNFNLFREFPELTSRPFGPRGEYFESARQEMQLRLDETGAVFTSANEFNTFSFGESDRPNPRRLTFDKPFLIALRERDDSEPYCVGWIGNADLMERLNE